MSPETKRAPGRALVPKAKDEDVTADVTLSPEEVKQRRLQAAIDLLSKIEAYLMTLVHADPIEHALLILAATRCRTAKDAIKSHLHPDPPPRRRERWWEK